mmetsp:Transcript_22800/g.63456  ORF Transcript_22800/g.63456 Transcript_22800/m.63456 type:complete len:207 (-) Transcript_22800:250-870(-)
MGNSARGACSGSSGASAFRCSWLAMPRKWGAAADSGILFKRAALCTSDTSVRELVKSLSRPSRINPRAAGSREGAVAVMAAKLDDQAEGRVSENTLRMALPAMLLSDGFRRTLSQLVKSHELPSENEFVLGRENSRRAPRLANSRRFASDMEVPLAANPEALLKSCKLAGEDIIRPSLGGTSRALSNSKRSLSEAMGLEDRLGSSK